MSTPSRKPQYRPLTFQEGRVEIAIERFPYMRTRHTYQYACGVCQKRGAHKARQKDARNDAHDHINAEHARLAHSVH